MTKPKWSIKADRTRCMGSGICVFHAPKTFDVDDDMRVVVLGAPADDLAAVRAAVEGCPTHALQLVEAENAGSREDSDAAR